MANSTGISSNINSIGHNLVGHNKHRKIPLGIFLFVVMAVTSIEHSMKSKTFRISSESIMTQQPPLSKRFSGNEFFDAIRIRRTEEARRLSNVLGGRLAINDVMSKSAVRANQIGQTHRPFAFAPRESSRCGASNDRAAEGWFASGCR